jgi:hypothetical protein
MGMMGWIHDLDMRYKKTLGKQPLGRPIRRSESKITNITASGGIQAHDLSVSAVKDHAIDHVLFMCVQKHFV